MATNSTLAVNPVLSISKAQAQTQTQDQAPDKKDIIPPLVLHPAEPMAEAIRQQTGDMICRALALECDRLEQALQYSIQRKLFKIGELATAIARRVSTLRCLGDRLDVIHEREEVTMEISAMAKVVRMAKDILRESGLPAETREMIFQSLVDRIASKQEEEGK